MIGSDKSGAQRDEKREMTDGLVGVWVLGGWEDVESKSEIR